MKRLTRKYMRTNGEYPGYPLLLAVTDYFEKSNYAVTITKDKPKVYAKKDFESEFLIINNLNALGCTYWNVNSNVGDEIVTVHGEANSPFVTFLVPDDFDLKGIAEFIKIFCSNFKKSESNGLSYSEI